MPAECWSCVTITEVRGEITTVCRVPSRTAHEMRMVGTRRSMASPINQDDPDTCGTAESVGPATELLSSRSEFGRLLSYVARFLPDPEDARDLVQDVWLTVLSKGPTFRGRCHPMSWVFSIARNHCLKELRRRRLRNRLLSHAVEDGRLKCLRADWLEPDEVLEQLELRQDLNRAIELLPRRQRAAVITRLVEGLSTGESASVLGCSPGAVKAYLSRARERLREQLANWRSEAAG